MHKLLSCTCTDCRLVFVLDGIVTLHFGSEATPLHSDDYAYLPPDTPHRCALMQRTGSHLITTSCSVTVCQINFCKQAHSVTRLCCVAYVRCSWSGNGSREFKCNMVNTDTFTAVCVQIKAQAFLSMRGCMPSRSAPSPLPFLPLLLATCYLHGILP